LAWLTGGVDEARRSADERLDEVLGQVDRTGVAVSGSRGDELPMTAFADAIREFDAEHILVAIPQTHSKVWQDKNLVEKLWSRFELPITVFKLA
jgi:hypothetical protein